MTSGRTFVTQKVIRAFIGRVYPKICKTKIKTAFHAVNSHQRGQFSFEDFKTINDFLLADCLGSALLASDYDFSIEKQLVGETKLGQDIHKPVTLVEDCCLVSSFLVTY